MSLVIIATSPKVPLEDIQKLWWFFAGWLDESGAEPEYGYEYHPNTLFFLIDEGVMVVAVQQPPAECTAIFTVCIVSHHPPPCAVTTHKTCTAWRCNGYQNAHIQDQG